MGHTMVTICAAAYTDIFMTQFEKDIQIFLKHIRTIKPEYNVADNKTPLLDTLISKDKNNILLSNI